MKDQYECAIFSRVRYPDDIAQWPEKERVVSQLAVDRLLRQQPNLVVVDDTTMCMDETDPRFPDDEKSKGNFFLVRRITLAERLR